MRKDSGAQRRGMICVQRSLNWSILGACDHEQVEGEAGKIWHQRAYCGQKSQTKTQATKDVQEGWTESNLGVKELENIPQ